MPNRRLLVCGVIASLLYVGIDWLAALRYPGYHSFTAQVVSELMASGAPTERLVDPLFLLYNTLVLAFAVGVWRSDRRKRSRITAASLAAFAAIGFLGPTVLEMNVRGSGESTSDLLHIVLTGALVVLVLATVVAGASLRGRAFRLYSYATVLLIIASGILTSFLIRGIGTGEPTPWVGLSERINIGLFLLWSTVLALSLLQAPRPLEAHPGPPGLRRPLPAR